MLLNEMETEQLNADQKAAAALLPENSDLTKYDWVKSKKEWVLKPGLIDGLKELTDEEKEKFDTPLDGEFGDLFSRAKEANAVMEEVTGKYLSFDDWKKDEERIMVFTGMATFTKKEGPDAGEIIPAVKLVDEKGTRFISAAAVLTGSLTGVTPPKAVKIKNLGKPAGKKYYDLKVYVAS